MTENAETGFIEQETRKRTFYGLDALRGIAAAVVVTRHAPALFGIGLFPNSSLGVDLFFVMSGFVIAHAYDQRIEKGLNWRQFLVIRAIRLYPLYLLGTAIGAASAAATLLTGVRSAQTGLEWHAVDLLTSFGLSLFLLPSPQFAGVDSLYPLNAVAWSLAFEVVVNVLFAAFHRFLTNRVLLAAMLVSGALLILATFRLGDVDIGWNWSNVLPGFTRVFYSFPAGVLLYRLWNDGRLRLASNILVPIVVTIAVFAVDLPMAGRLSFSLLAVLFVFPAVTILARCRRLSPTPW